MLSRLKAGQRARWVWRRAAARYPWLAAMRRRLAAAVVSMARPAASSNLEEGGVNPANIVWIFCVARSRSTWLAEMMSDLRGHNVW
jgi:hypothetical protein